MAAGTTEATLAQGVARMLEKFVEETYARDVDEVRLTTARPEATHIVTTDALPSEDKAVVERLLRQQVSRTAFRSLYRQRVRGFQERLIELEPRVADELARVPQQQVTIGVRGRQNMQITIGSKQQQQQQQPSASAAQASAPARLAARAPPLTKGVLRQAVADATQKAMMQLGVDAHQPFRAALAAQAAGHPQLRALVVAALPETIQAARHAAESKRTKPAAADGDRSRTRPAELSDGHAATAPAAAAAAAASTTALGRKSAPRLPASALVVKIKAKPS
jgi:hypothetical protein